MTDSIFKLFINGNDVTIPFYGNDGHQCQEPILLMKVIIVDRVKNIAKLSLKEHSHAKQF
jgi:hypothetical protein